MRANILSTAAILLTAGCAVQGSNPSTVEQHYDVPPQVIYRIDDHRFISLENYKDCHYGTTYYNDIKLGIRTRFGRGGGIENYRGRLINADPSGRYIVVPSSFHPNGACPDKGCNIAFIYSTDAGRTFQSGGYYISNTQTPYLDSADYIVTATADRIYIAKKWGSRDYSVEQYPLIPGIDLRKELPPGIKGDRFRASDRPDYLKGLRTPSGQEYLSCDDSIRPKNLPPKK
ncbi:hypothetical protein CupriaWKF_19325 [Cupriavidus sp. WKF15]|uniref:T6SS immunity protein Tli3 family protein n=1 Tax=Cupriavidus sp. WKF15 TaxID=3032282 RepID=UPI0023E2BFF6|nr:hypothetical protein [Cupriavidus sp. WKF15]WER49307.1 hypothetical protein CupriaWKF_19325 [Cupriavidus sp. WKF15]